MAKKSTLGKRQGSGGVVKLAVIALVILAVGYLGWTRFFSGTSSALEFQKGMGYCTWSKAAYISPGSDKSLESVKELGTGHVAILTTWYQTNCWSGDIQRGDKTPTDESLVHAIRKARESGMKVMLKPHLDLIDTSDGSWRGEIGCVRDPEWEAWFKEYTKFIMHYVDIARKEKVEMFCIGTELSTAATVKGYLWNDLIKKVRSKYKGQLTYAAHWDRYMDIRFWDQLDYIGINAYFPLTEEQEPTYDELLAGWTKWVDEMETFQKQVGKPIIFPEIGCASADGAAIRPWEHVPRSEVNLELQEDYYRALLNTFWGKEWFYGMYWWYWGTNVNMGGKYNRGFTPQNKPAEKVVDSWYSKKDPR